MRYIPLALVCSLLAVGGCKSNSGDGAGSGLPAVGFLQIASNPILDASREGFVRGLAEGGFEDGKTIRIITKDAQGEMPTAQLIAKDFVGQNVKLIGIASTPALQAAMASTKEIPIVFSAVSDPYKAGAGEKADQHKPNVTGAYGYLPVDKCLQLVHEVAPSVKKVGTLYDPGEVFTEIYLKMARDEAKRLGLEWIEVAAPATSDIVPGVQALKSRGVEAILQVPSNLIYTGIDGAIREATKLKMPIFSVDPTHVEAGEVAALGLHMQEWGYAAGKIAARVMKGEDPATIPFEVVTKQSLVLNPRAASTFNITFPKSVTERADRVITK